MPTFSGRCTVRTPSGRSTGSQPLPTTTTSRSTPSLGQQRRQGAGELRGPGAHAEHDGTDRRPGHRSLLDVRIAARCPTTVRPAAGTSDREKQPGGLQPAAGGRVDDTGDQREQRQLDGVERPVERHEPSQRPQPPDAGDLRGDLLGAVLQLRQPVHRAGDVHGVVERLVHQDQHRQHRAEGGPPAQRVEAAVGADAERERDGALGDGVAQLVEEEAGRGERLRQRATSPSQQSQSICSWASRAASTAPTRPGSSRAAPAAAPVTIISTVTPLAVIAVPSRSRVRYGDRRRW